MYLGDEDGLSGMCCDDCAGLAGMGDEDGLSGLGLNTNTPTGITQDCSGLPILDWIKCQANKITSSLPSTSGPVYNPPIYTPPYYPTTQTPAAPSNTMFSTTPNWLPYALGAVAVVMLARRK